MTTLCNEHTDEVFVAEYRCPKEIADLYEENPGEGRMKAVEWLMGLDLQIGDKIWMPEEGWYEKTEEVTKQ